MLTVKISETHNDIRGFMETIFEASQVRRDGEKILVDHAEGGQSSWDIKPENKVEIFMYVVNRNGATVATYRL